MASFLSNYYVNRPEMVPMLFSPKSAETNLNSPASNCFKYTPNKHIFSHLEPTYHTYPMKSHPPSPSNKQHPAARKVPQMLLPFGALCPGGPLPCCWATSSRQVGPLSDFPYSPRKFLALFPFWVWPCASVSGRFPTVRHLPYKATLSMHHPNKACVLPPLTNLSLPWSTSKSPNLLHQPI